MKAVLDTNVLISAVIATGVPHDVLLKGFHGGYQLVASEATVAEFARTLHKYPDRFGLSEAEIRAEVPTVRGYAKLVNPECTLSAVAADPDDDKFLEAAVAADADYVVSGDTHLLDLDQFSGVHIVTPREFYEILEQNS